MAVCGRCGAELPSRARFCPVCAAPVAGEVGGEERKLATVLFADLVGSTEFGGSHDPERTRLLLERFYDAMAEEVERAGGTVEKFVGDAVMAAFGAPAALEDHAERALHAALAMRRRFDDLFGGELALRIGVDTGDVVVGRPREGSSFVTGDAVNVAARLEQVAEAGEILVGARTAAAVRGAFEFEEPATVEAKGKPGGVIARRLVRGISLARPRGIGGLRRAFVGRDAELERLLEVYRIVASERRPRLVTIVGDAGVGKTRLMRELWELLSAESPSPLRRTGRCLSYGQGITFWPLAEILKEHFGILDNDPPEAVLARLAEREFLGVTLGLDVARGMHPLLVRDRFQDAWVEFLEDATSEQPLVMLIEDIYWAEEQLLDLLELLVENVRGPVLMLATARPELLERGRGWGSRASAELVELEALSAEDSVRMLDGLLAGELPPKLRDLVVARAEGNPFFVEELVGTMIDRGLLQPADGGWRLDELPADFSVPDSVTAVIAARIDLLGPAEKIGLQAASVIGRIFWAGPVYELVPRAEPDLRTLEERDFIRRRHGSSIAGEREYAIKHALTRDVAYESLPKTRRGRLHAAFAGWLERLGGDRDDFAPLLAHHYAAAARPEDADLAWAGEKEELARLRANAVVWLRRAAELATTRYELDEAVALLQQALPLEPEPARRAELWYAAGHVHALRFDGARFVEAMQRAIESTDDPALQAETYAELALHTAGRSGMWRSVPANDLVEGWIERALELSLPTSRARAKALIARSFWRGSEAGAPAREASVLAEKLGDVHLRTYALEARVLAAYGQGEYSESLAWAERLTHLVDELSDPDLIADVHAAAIPPALALGRFREAERLARAFREVSESLTTHHRVHGVAVSCEVEELRGGWNRILELEQAVLERVENNLDTPCVRNPRTLLVCALAHLHTGDRAAADHLEERAHELWMEGYGLTLDGPRLKLALARGDLEQAEVLVAAGFTLRRQTWFFLSSVAARLDALAALGRPADVETEVAAHGKRGTILEPFAWRALGIVREDETLIERALERFAAMHLDWHAEQTRKLLAEA
jgi:class 3 adenylate cyclase/tetratricopeptide (TPR) repeat protein